MTRKCRFLPEKMAPVLGIASGGAIGLAAVLRPDQYHKRSLLLSRSDVGEEERKIWHVDRRPTNAFGVEEIIVLVPCMKPASFFQLPQLFHFTVGFGFVPRLKAHFVQRPVQRRQPQ